jgi:transcriptional regulator with XRE-family HTH domain
MKTLKAQSSKYRENFFSKAIKYWMLEKRIKQSEISYELGIKASTVSQWCSGQRVPKLETIDKIAAIFDANTLQFLNCQSEDGHQDIEFIDRLTARPRAGTGGLETDAEYAGRYAFHKSFILRKRGTAESMKLFEVAGDSMIPTLDSGDLIMVNLNEKDVRSGCIYLLQIDEELMVKRLENRPGKLIIRSDNDKYHELEIDRADESKKIIIYGRMVWSCREY